MSARTCLFESLEDRRLLSATITSITATPNPVARLAKVSLTASGVTTTGKAVSVSYYVDVNSDGIIDKGDLRIGTSANSKTNFSVSRVIPKAFPATDIPVLAAAKDKDGATNAVSTTVTVTNVDPSIKSLVAVPAKVLAAKAVTLVAAGATDKDGKVSKVDFYNDENGNGILDGGDVLLGSDLSAAGGWRFQVAANTFSAGTVHVIAVATDNNNGVSAAAAKTLTVT